MRSIHLGTYVSIFGLIGLAGLAPAPVFAQNAAPQTTTANPSPDNAPNGEIVVTAQRRAEKQVDVPITITALSNQKLTDAGVQQLADISKLTPSLRFDNASGFFQPTIRGVGTPVTTSGGGSNVGIYIDGFYSPNPLAADFQLAKVQSVDVLKGPQGTLFGHNTTGGAIQVTTTDPSTTTDLEGKISYGRFNEIRQQAYASFGLAQNVAFDIEGSHSSGDGYLTNISDGRRVGDWHDWSVRTGLKFWLGSNVSVLLRYQHSSINDPNPALTASYFNPSFGGGQPFFAAPGQYTYSPNQVALGSTPGDDLFITMKSDVYQGTIKADLGFADLTSYSQYRKETVNQNISLDYAGTATFDLGLPNHNSTWSQEFLLTSKKGSKLQWTAGLFGFGNVDTYLTFADVSGGVPISPPARIGGSSTNTQSFAAFVDATYELTPRLFLTAGARYSHDEVIDAYFNSATFPANVTHDPSIGFPVPSIRSNHVTPRAVIRFKPDDRSSLYASFTEGYKASIIDVGGSCQDSSSNFGNPPFTCNPIKPEKIDSYEVGYKFDNRRFSFDLSAFYYNYRDLQVSVYLNSTAYILNAATSHIYGLDGQFTGKLTNNLELDAAGAWTHARFVRFNNAPDYVSCPSLIGAAACGAGGISFLVPGNTLANSTMERTPEFSGDVMLRYTHELANGKLALSSGLNYTSKVYFGYAGNQFPQSGYATVDARAQWTDPTNRYTVAVYGVNLTNKRYMTEVQASNFGIGANWNKPVTYGVEFGAKF